MIIIRQPSGLQNYINRQKAEGLTIGFVPTMGALHNGHLHLINMSKQSADITVCSIFVNPTQFNDQADFRKYPNTPESDIALLERASADVLFVPEVNAVYADGTENLEKYELGRLESLLEGKYRPGHFQGVCQVMSRLLRFVKPHKLFMGQKDYQQCMVIRKLLTYLDFPVQLVISPTMRESDGLAMSSRNLRLKDTERPAAAAIYESLQHIKQNIIAGPVQPLKEEAKQLLEKRGFRVDYVEIAEADSLEPVESWDGNMHLVALVAAFLGEVRLIDNVELS
jgi:pantoate--beta-alanine ligase